MLRVAISPYDHVPLRQALMACVEPAGGELIRLDGPDNRVGHLVDDQVRGYVTALKNYSRDHPMPDDDNSATLSWILHHLGTYEYSSVIILEKDSGATLYASHKFSAFGEMMMTGYGVGAAMAAFDSLADELLITYITSD